MHPVPVALGLVVSDLPRTLAFYRALGLDIHSLDAAGNPNPAWGTGVSHTDVGTAWRWGAAAPGWPCRRARP